MLRSARNIKTIASAGLHRRFFASAGRRRVPVFNLDNDTPKGSALVMAFQSPLNKNPQQNSGGAGSPTSVAATASGESTSVLSNGCGCTDAQGKVIAPLRVATSSTGISKAHAKLTPAWNGQMTYSWDPVELENLATEGMSFMFCTIVMLPSTTVRSDLKCHHQLALNHSICHCSLRYLPDNSPSLTLL